jgi:hypothetical protein
MMMGGDHGLWSDDDNDDYSDDGNDIISMMSVVDISIMQGSFSVRRIVVT